MLKYLWIIIKELPLLIVKYFLFCALNNHKIEILSFFFIPRKSLVKKDINNYIKSP